MISIFCLGVIILASTEYVAANIEAPNLEETFQISTGWNKIFGQHKETDGSDTHPSVRYGHSSVIFDDKLIISHGYYYSRGMKFKSDTWSYDLKKNKWSKIADAGKVIPGRKGKKFPKGRFGHSGVVRNGIFYIFGGDDYARYTTGKENWSRNDLWSLDLKYPQRGWLEILAKRGIRPKRRAFHGTVMIGDEMCIFGGKHVKSDVWCYNFDNNKWREIAQTAPHKATNYHGMSMVPHPTKQGFILHGGHMQLDGKHYGNIEETWSFDMKSGKWSQLASLPQELSRANHDAVLVGKGVDAEMMVFSGNQCRTGASCFVHPNTMIYNIARDRWRLLDVQNKIFGRYHHNIALHDATRTIYLTGGETMSPNYMYHNSIYALPLTADVGNKEQVREHYDREL